MANVLEFFAGFVVLSRIMLYGYITYMMFTCNASVGLISLWLVLLFFLTLDSKVKLKD